MPIHEHDCNHCTFIKTAVEVDYYICLNSDGTDGSLIKRYSDEPSDNTSYNLQHLLVDYRQQETIE